MDKIQEALKLTEIILEAIELENSKLSSIALRCLRLSRLLSDNDAIQWFQYEVTGYPRSSNGYLISEAFNCAYKNGRGLPDSKEGHKQVFSELAENLETEIESYKITTNSLTTQGLSLNGEMIASTMRELSKKILNQNALDRTNVNKLINKLTKIKGAYYSYVLSVNLELKFSQQAEEIFRDYRISVDSQLKTLVPNTLSKLASVFERLKSDDQESWYQSLTSCRRLFQEFSETLFQKLFPNFQGDEYETKSGKKLKVDGDKYMNKLSAIIDFIGKSNSVNRLIGSNLLYIIDFVENLHKFHCLGVHELKNTLTFEEAKAVILHTYITLGNIVKLAPELITSNIEET